MFSVLRPQPPSSPTTTFSDTHPPSLSKFCCRRGYSLFSVLPIVNLLRSGFASLAIDNTTMCDQNISLHEHQSFQIPCFHFCPFLLSLYSNSDMSFLFLVSVFDIVTHSHLRMEYFPWIHRPPSLGTNTWETHLCWKHEKNKPQNSYMWNIKILTYKMDNSVGSGSSPPFLLSSNNINHWI